MSRRDDRNDDRNEPLPRRITSEEALRDGVTVVSWKYADFAASRHRGEEAES